MASLTEIILPESVRAIRAGAFTAKGGVPLFIKLPEGLDRITDSAFNGGFYDADADLPVWKKTYYISTVKKEHADRLCGDSYGNGERNIIYTGGPLDDLSQRTRSYAVQGFSFAEMHSSEDMSQWRSSYLKYIKRNEKTYLKKVLEDGDLLHLMLDEKLISQKGIQVLLKQVADASRTDLTAALLEYQSSNFESGLKMDDFSLRDNDAELKRMIAMSDRREQIKDQKGIKGLVFVATGDFRNFGYCDIYTGAKDMSDLKAYIEERGGFLRSAVSSKTDYLICNDPNSETAKSKKAKELGVPVITENEFLKMAEEKE